MKNRGTILLVGVLLVMAAQLPAVACTACYGRSDSDLAKGMNMGILVLLGFIGVVLACVASFAIYLVRRGAVTAAQAVEVAAATNTTPLSTTKN